MAMRIADVREGGWRPDRARRQDIASILESIFLFIRASFGRGGFMSLSPTPIPRGTGVFLLSKTKIPSSISGTKEFLRGTTQLTFKHANVTLIAITGLPVADYLRCFFRVHQRSLLLSKVEGDNRRVQSWNWHSRSMPVKGFHLALPSR